MQADTLEAHRLIDLDDPGAAEAELVGAKAARLAAARHAGLPVLPGIVVPVEASRSSFRRAAAIARQSGLAAARLFLFTESSPADLESVARSALGTGALVVRSSSPLESDRRWSGAFASYVGIAAGELATAVGGCWASAFGRDASERFEELGLDQSAAGMGVLVQRCVIPAPGGIAVVDGRGIVVTVAEGSLAGMLQGWEEGVSGTCDAGGAPEGAAVDRFGAALVADAGRVALRCAETIGDDHLEWASVDGEIVILQCRRLEDRRLVAGGRGPVDPRLRSAAAARAARIVSRYGGRAGDALVLPWALAPAGRLQPASSPRAVRPTSFRAVEATAAKMAAVAWQRKGEEALAEAKGCLEALRTRLDAGALERMESLCPVDPLEGARLIAGLEVLGANLAAGGLLADPSDVWRLSLPELAGHIAGAAVPPPDSRPPLGPDPWEPFLLESIRANGSSISAWPASDGAGAGRLRRLEEPGGLSGSLQRYVLYVPVPHPGYAPLLWGAAGLVAAGGNAGAHLFDVARSLGVPAVICGAPPEWEGIGEVAAAVDGSSGELAWLCSGGRDGGGGP